MCMYRYLMLIMVELECFFRYFLINRRSSEMKNNKKRKSYIIESTENIYKLQMEEFR